MREALFDFLRCPVCKGNLQLQIIKSAPKKFKTVTQTVVESGVFVCTCNFLFPVVESVPRMLIESFIEYEDFLRQHVPDFLQIKQSLLGQHHHLIESAQKRNRQTKSSFSFEWNLLKGKSGENIWRLDEREYRDQLFNELDLSEQYFKNKLAIDVGCGHGRSTELLSEKCKTAIGMDLGSSVVKACADNLSENCHFLQGDLHCPPFVNNSFDIVYSSGVLHHTPDTENAFNIVSGLVSMDGVYCVWLYRPSNNRVHKIIISCRKMTTHLSLRFQFWLYLIFFLPLHKWTAWIRHRKSKSWREIMIELFDTFSPRYRFEHEPEEVRSWFAKNDFTDIKVSSVNAIGFSMKGQRK